MKKTVLALVWAAAAAGTLCGALVQESPSGRKRELETEVGLAKSARAYLVIDFPAKTIDLRIRGLALRRWALAASSRWGRPLRGPSYKLLSKTALKTPKRTNITPSKEKVEKDKSDGLEVLELSAMPRRFGFLLDGGVRLSFKPKPGGLFARVGGWGASLGRSLYLPLKTLWTSIRGAKFTDIQITVSSDADAQGIYWAAQEGMGILVILKKSE